MCSSKLWEVMTFSPYITPGLTFDLLVTPAPPFSQAAVLCPHWRSLVHPTVLLFIYVFIFSEQHVCLSAMIYSWTVQVCFLLSETFSLSLHRIPPLSHSGLLLSNQEHLNLSSPFPPRHWFGKTSAPPTVVDLYWLSALLMAHPLNLLPLAVALSDWLNIPSLHSDWLNTPSSHSPTSRIVESLSLLSISQLPSKTS